MDGKSLKTDSESTPMHGNAAQGRVIVRFRVTGQQGEMRNDIEELKVGQNIIVDMDKGPELATVLQTNLPPTTQKPKYKTLRHLNKQDHDTVERHAIREKEAKAFCKSLILEHKLSMKLVDVEFAHSGKRAIFYFTSANRIDFRALVKDLAKRFHTRIEMRQIGVRDAARHTGGLGICGRELCCSTWLPTFKPISLRLAKTQNLTLNQQKLSGVCGRLRCCLAYEHEVYQEFKKSLPKVGKRVHTPQGDGKVVDVSIFKQDVRVVLKQGLFATFPAQDVQAFSQEELNQIHLQQNPNSKQNEADPEKSKKHKHTKPRKKRFKKKDS